MVQAQQEHQVKTLNQLDSQIDAFTQNAKQGVAADYRTQARDNLNDSQWHLKQKLSLLPSVEATHIDMGRLDALLSTVISAFPSTGSLEQLQRSLVAMLAVFFDLLPVVGVALLGRDHPQEQSEEHPQEQITTVPHWYDNALEAIRNGDINASIRGIKEFASVGEPKAKEFMNWYSQEQAA